MRRSHGGEEEDEVSFSIWARVGVDWRGRSKKKRKKKKKKETLAWLEPLFCNKHEQEKGKAGKSSLYIESEDGSHKKQGSLSLIQRFPSLRRVRLRTEKHLT